jgi:anti-anti-sigma factor
MDLRSDLQVDVSEMQARVPLTLVRISGRINLSNSEQLEQLAHDLQTKGAKHVLLDLSDVPSITSAGLRAMHLMYRLFEAGGSAEGAKSAFFKVYTPSPQVRAVLHTAGFDTYIDTYDDRQSAIAAF